MSGSPPRASVRPRPRPSRSTRSTTLGRPRAVRALATITLLAASAALYGVTASSAFGLAPGGLTVRGATFTGADSVRRSLGIEAGSRPNLFALDTSGLALALRGLPTVDAARADAVSVRVVLPDRMVVELHERVPILVWQVGAQRFLVDIDGVLLAEAGPGTTSGLPVVADSRAIAHGLHLGGRLAPVDLAVARSLGAVTPAMLGSAAPALGMAVSDDEGFVLSAADASWRAVFGIYTSHVRSPELVPAQVQCLAALLHGQEAALAVVYLFPEGGRCGTYTRRTRAP